MKKALVALAVAGVVAPVAQADNVVLYGRLNTAVQYTKIQDGQKDTTLSNQNSRFGLKGEERIGGLTAEFQIENGFDSANGKDTTSGLASRDTFVGLRGDFGRVRLGRNETPTWKLFDTTVSKFHHAGLADFTAGVNSLSGVGRQGARFGKSGIYTTPDFANFSASVLVADQIDAANGIGATKSNVDGSLMYGGGSNPITAGFAFRTNKDIVTSEKDTIYALAGKYRQDLFDISALYERDDLKSAVAGGRKKDLLFISGQYNIGNAAIVASFGHAFKNKDNGNSIADTDASQYTLGGQYDLSNRTQVYGYYTKLDNKNAGTYGFTHTTLNTSPVKDTQGVVLGLRHNF